MVAPGISEVRDLLSRCDEELESEVEGAVLRSRFRYLLNPSIVAAVWSEAIECEAFVLGACDALEDANWQWPAPTLLRIGELAAHLGHLDEAARIAIRSLRGLPGNTDPIVLWAETAPSAQEVIQRYLDALNRADDRPGVIAAARHYAIHSPEAIERSRQLEQGLAGTAATATPRIPRDGALGGDREA